MVNRTCVASVILLVLGIACLVTSLLLIFLGDSFIKNSVKKGCQLRPGTLVYKIWHDSPVPMRISMYVFDLGNDTGFLNGTSKPHVRQRGPFVYREERKKHEIQLYENGTISYHESRSYAFEPTLSAEPETAKVTTLNIVYMTLANYLQMEHTPNIVRRIVGELLSIQEHPIMTRTVKEILWGYEDPLLHTLKKDLPELVTSDVVSVFYAAVSDIELNTLLINNGVGDDADHNERIQNVGVIERFNFQTNLSYWSDEYANMINGTDSTIWHPTASKTERIHTFIPDICRSVYLTFNETRQNSFSIDTYRYAVPDAVFSNSTENRGFCLNSTAVNKSSELECLPSGLFSLSRCVHLSGSSVAIPLPIIASSPHFLAADLAVQDAIVGLSPDDVNHRSFMDIEPITGVVMNGSRRLQININVINDSTIDAISRVNRMVFPLIWIDEHAEIDQTNADTFRHQVLLPITLVKVLKYVLLGVGIAFFMIIIGIFAYRRHSDKETGPAFPSTRADEISPLLS